MPADPRFSKETFERLDILLEALSWEVGKEISKSKYPVRGKPEYYLSLLTKGLKNLEDKYGFDFGNGVLSNSLPDKDYLKNYLMSNADVMGDEVRRRLIDRFFSFYDRLEAYRSHRESITL